ncbi:MAG: hypothetical protein KY452_10605 [Actinobacteria bacterium]|nr:hypothetical protein [Actinomycetota bacterium]
MKNLLRRLSKADDPARRQEIERQAADEIKAAGSTPPAEANSGSWAPSAPDADTDTAQPEAAPAPAAPNRRLTAQQRAAARKLQTQN